MSMIIAQSPKTYFGAGDIQKSLGSLPGFPWAKYPGEKHLLGHNYTGPGTRLDLRLDENDIPKPGEEPVNRVDAAALKHDILYRNKDITFRHQADKQMIDELKNIPNPTFKEKLQRALTIKLLKAKLKLESKNPMSSTAFINKAKPFFVDQIGDTLQGDIDMNNFKITNLKFPGNDNDAVNKKYLLDQINAIQIDKDHVENRINDVKRYIRRNIKNLVDEPKLQQELTSLKRLIQVDKTSQLQNLISKLDDKITKVKIDVQRLIDNPNVNEDRLKRKLTALERKLGELLTELDKTADKTELQNSISNLNEKIAKQKSDVQDIINTFPIDKDTLKRQLTALDTKITDELEKEVGVIKNFLQNKFRDDMKNYIKEQVNLLVSRIHDDFLRQERKLTKLEAIVTDKSYYFNLPFESDTVFNGKDQIYKSNKYGFKAEIKVGSLVDGEPKNVFDIGETEAFTFRGNCLIQIGFPMKVKVNKVVFKQTGNAVKHISLFNDGNLEENIRLIDKRDQEIETKNSKYVDTFKMEVENDKDNIGIKDLDMILETENPPSTNIVKVSRRLHVYGSIESSSHEFLRTTDFEHVKLYFALGEKYTSIDVHKSQQEREFIVHLSFAEDSILEGGGYIFRAKIKIEKEKIKYSYHLKEDHTKKEMSLVRVNVVTFNTRKYNNARPNKYVLYDIPWFHLSEIHLI
ncbi:hypothetical protein LOTGIDRAFT_165346 [Lottia gigantea]|uniref:Phospholipase A2-like domain-containing protein n=1 Tax=Lottia gigantea TaxID=225164 RepID=V3ZBZ8_LOTGI|nr:hypothetical protein LOTGIDRAFT_165346 [Lottia gigantea]ESO88563.1 hypothetical protein LOTGIDRAFT_165346 [Lottia gigantea]